MTVMSFTDFAARYAAMGDEEILGLALAPADLKPEAHLALERELQRRKLSKANVEGYRNYLIATKPREVVKPIATSWNGIGTSIYGKRDFRPDGSFLTTKWLIAYFVPIVPIKSVRVSKIRGGYLIHQGCRPNIRQVLCVYLFVLTLTLTLSLALIAATEVHSNIPLGLSYAAVLCVCLAPWLLRKAARAKDKGLRDASL